MRRKESLKRDFEKVDEEKLNGEGFPHEMRAEGCESKIMSTPSSLAMTSTLGQSAFSRGQQYSTRKSSYRS